MIKLSNIITLFNFGNGNFCDWSCHVADWQIMKAQVYSPVWALYLSRNATVSRSGPSLTYKSLALRDRERLQNYNKTKDFLSHTIFSSSARRHCRWLWQPCITTLFLTSCFVFRIRKDGWLSRSITIIWMAMLRQLSRKGMWIDSQTVTCRIHIFFQPGLLIVFTLKRWNWPALLKWPLGNGFGLTWKKNISYPRISSICWTSWSHSWYISIT